MKNTNLTDQILFQTEQENDFRQQTTMMQMQFMQMLSGQNINTLPDLASSEIVQAFTPYISGDLEVLKLHIAVHITDCIRIAEDEGAPGTLMENLKKDAFTDIAKASSIEELSEISFSLVRNIMWSYRKYSIHDYSYNIKRAVDHIHACVFKPLHAADVAEALSLERTALSKTFHKEVGMTMTDYINTLKIDTAANLIKRQAFSLTEIADMLGFSSYAYFCSVFKKYKNCAPSQY